MHIGFHLAAGVVGDAVSNGEPVSIAAGCTLAVASHWMLDDLNVGSWAKLKHEIENLSRPHMLIYLLGLVISISLVIWYTFWLANDWRIVALFLVCGVSLDWERVTELLGLTKNNWLHLKMWPKVAHTKWAFTIKLIAVLLLVLWIQPYW